MGTKDWITDVAGLHKEWVNIAKVYGAGADAEDLVQESYIKLLRYDCKNQAIKNGNVNRGFIFFVVKNTVLNYHKFKQNTTHDIPVDLIIDETNDQEQAWNRFCEKVDDVSLTWKWSDRQIFDDYRFTEDSIRGVGRKYDISFVTIFNTIKECKKHINYELKEDYEDFKNGDYEKI